MARTSKPRHTKTKREPVTIDLEAENLRATAATADERVDEPPSAQAPAQPGAAGTEKEETPATPETEPKQAEAVGEASEPAPQEAAMAGTGGGTRRALVAGLSGGLIALLAAGGLQWAGFMPIAGEPDPAVEMLGQEQAALRDEIVSLREAALADTSGEPLEQLRDQIEELRAAMAAMPPPAALDAGEAVDALADRLAAIEERLPALSQARAVDADAISERMAVLESELSEISRSMTELQGQTASQRERLDALTERLEARDEGPRLARLVAASALSSAVERGTPYRSELDTYLALAPEAPELEALRRHADTGISTRAQLSAEAPTVASRIVAAASAPGAEAGFIERLLASARSAVTVRPVGEVAGDTPAAVAARMEAAVQADDYERALSQIESLPPDAAASASDFAARLKARQSADNLLDDVLSTALQPG